MTEKQRKKQIMDWNNELKYQERVLDDPILTEEQKEQVKARIVEVKKQLEELEVVEDCGAVQPIPLIKPERRPRKRKDGSIKWGDMVFQSEEDLLKFLNTIPCDSTDNN